MARMPRRRSRADALPLTVLVQQLAALLRGGRSTSRLWEELWMVHEAKDHRIGPGDSEVLKARGKDPGLRKLSSGSLQVLAAAQAASMMGTSVAEAIRTSSANDLQGGNSVERRIWRELAACLDVAEASGCPLADVLSRFAAQLDAEDDAGDARQTALAGPKATLRLLTWLPVFGLGLGMMLGVDPLEVLLANGVGLAALAAGCVLTVIGRIWSSRLVRAAVGVD
ncbi:type II secretion system F family protein [Arthrobacter ramosus]|uniref:Type II secretion system F family protein n=1 Tax=Arthrobacter ramosus TaxID=1672 RepID=A0ABV5XUJ2_ARTRM